jgi:phosphoribosylformimino-5-aminoimidazole carboxamide ribotide isomerase
MILLPAIDLKDGKCVRLRRGDFSTAEQVAGDPLETARAFRAAGARWLHVVDLDGAKKGAPVQSELIFRIARSSGLAVEVGGGIRSMEAVDRYLQNGISRVILGTAAIDSPDFVRAAVEKHGEKIAVGIDAKDGMAARNGWTGTSGAFYIDLAQRMERLGVKYIIFTDIGRDGMLSGPNLEQLDRLNQAVPCRVTASGGVANLKDVANLLDLGLYGAICGRALYAGTLDLKAAVALCGSGKKRAPEDDKMNRFTDRLFRKSELVPAVIQEAGTGQVLMVAYMNRESFRRTLATGYTWFYSRSRKKLWNKGETSGHFQKVLRVWSDCDDDTLLLSVEQTGPACHTGHHSCFFHKIWGDFDA